MLGLIAHEKHPAPEDWRTFRSDRLRETLSPLGFHMFRLLYVEDRSVEETATTVKMSAEAVYAWRSRLRKLVTSLAADLVTPMPKLRGLP